MHLAIDPALYPAAMAKVVRRLGRLHVPGFFAGDGADQVVAALAGETRGTFAGAHRHAVTGWVRC